MVANIPDYDLPVLWDSEFALRGDVYRVGSDYYQTITDTQGTFTFYMDAVPITSGAQALSQEEWDLLLGREEWHYMGKADPNKTAQEQADEFSVEFAKGGIFNSSAWRDADWREVFARAVRGEFDYIDRPGTKDPLQMTEALLATGYGQSTVAKQREFDTANPVEQNMLIVQAAEQLASLWKTYTGAVLAVPGTREGLEKEAPALFQQALQLARGLQSEHRAVLDWIQPEAMKIDQSPWQRMLAKEDQLQRQEGIDIETQRGTVRDLAESYGLTLTDKKLMTYGQQLVDNEVSLDELEQKLDEQSIGLYPYKPKGMEWVTYADPYIKAKADLWEVADPDHTDEDLQDILQSNGTLGDWKKQLRKDPHWYGTDNARNTFFSAFGSVGRGMGFG
jgi:hypothetical protein